MFTSECVLPSFLLHYDVVFYCNYGESTDTSCITKLINGLGNKNITTFLCLILTSNV